VSDIFFWRIVTTYLRESQLGDAMFFVSPFQGCLFERQETPPENPVAYLLSSREFIA